MTLAACVLILCAAMALPYRLRLEHAPPAFAAAVWLSVLMLRAVASVAAALAAEVYLPTTTAAASVTRWCGSPVSGHDVGDLVLALPAVALAGSLIWVLITLWDATRRADALVRAAMLDGPGESLVVPDGALLIAAAGLWRPRVLVSAGALLALDDDELAASLAHERGHIARRHRYVIVAGELARALARFVPGTRTATRELIFHLERDADRYAVRGRHDPAVLASAICKAAQDAVPAAPTLSPLGGGVVTRRLRQLLDGVTGAEKRPHLALLTVIPIMVCLIAATTIAMPFIAHATYHEHHENPAALCRAQA